MSPPSPHEDDESPSAESSLSNEKEEGASQHPASACMISASLSSSCGAAAPAAALCGSVGASVPAHMASMAMSSSSDMSAPEAGSSSGSTLMAGTGAAAVREEANDAVSAAWPPAERPSTPWTTNEMLPPPEATDWSIDGVRESSILIGSSRPCWPSGLRRTGMGLKLLDFSWPRRISADSGWSTGEWHASGEGLNSVIWRGVDAKEASSLHGGEAAWEAASPEPSPHLAKTIEGSSLAVDMATSSLRSFLSRLLILRYGHRVTPC
mmetsp:Transcript_27119/g.66884  ORF Transcript_27119/g.66884 Transcript_27119/m.66884 type:complete len:266 (+) Transcript_27119:993-1790(+)